MVSQTGAAQPDARNKIINNLTRQFSEILRRAGVRKGQFHDLRRTALSNFFACGMSTYEVMILAGHAKFSTTQEFYLVTAPDLLDRARAASEQTVCKNLARIWRAP